MFTISTNFLNFEAIPDIRIGTRRSWIVNGHATTALGDLQVHIGTKLADPF
jgi:hypothetical protein